MSVDQIHDIIADSLVLLQEEKEREKQANIKDFKQVFKEQPLEFDLMLNYTHSRYIGMCVGDVLSLIGTTTSYSDEIYLQFKKPNVEKLINVSIEQFKNTLIFAPLQKREKDKTLSQDFYYMADIASETLVTAIQNKKVISIGELARINHALFIKLFSRDEIVFRVDRNYSIDNILSKDTPVPPLYFVRCYEGFNRWDNKLYVYETGIKSKYLNNSKYIFKVPVFSVG